MGGFLCGLRHTPFPYIAQGFNIENPLLQTLPEKAPVATTTNNLPVLKPYNSGSTGREKSELPDFLGFSTCLRNNPDSQQATIVSSVY